MLGTRDADRLHHWYTTALPPEHEEQQDQYRILAYGSFWLFLDQRDDVEAATTEPNRTLINFDVEDAKAVCARIDELGSTWIAPLEDRDGSLMATAADPDGNAVQVIQLSPEHRAEMEAQLKGRSQSQPESPSQAQPSGPLGAAEAFSGYSVDDLDAAVHFYGEVLGLPVERTQGPMAMVQLHVGGRTILLYPKPDHVPATYTVLNFPVADVRAAVTELTGRGVAFQRYPGFEQDDLGIHTGGGPLIAWFTDPAGNVLSVLEEALPQ